MQSNAPRQRQIILVVEDDQDDAFFIQNAFEKAAGQIPLVFVTGGQEAIAYLNGDAPYTDREKYPLPGLVLLDIGMPLKDGLEVLKWIRCQPEFAGIRVVVLTGSEEKRAACYALGADSFMVKPLASRAAADLCRSISLVEAGR